MPFRPDPPSIGNLRTLGDGRGGILDDRAGSTATHSLGQTIDEGAAVSSVDQAGLLSSDFGIINIAANQSAVALRRATPGSTIQADVVGIAMPYRGSLAAISFKANDSKTAGSCTLTAYIDGVASDLSVDWDTSTSTGYAVLVQGSAGFEAGAELDIRITTDSGFTPTTADLIATLFVALTPTTSL